jgi:hypothetical protein
MATFSKLKLSESTNGRSIKVAGTTTNLHTAHATSLDEVWLYAYNSSASAVELTVQWGGTTPPDDSIKITVPSKVGLTLVVPGLIATGSIVVSALAAITNVILVYGYVNRVTP